MRDALQRPLAWPRYGLPLCSRPTRPTLAPFLNDIEPQWNCTPACNSIPGEPSRLSSEPTTCLSPPCPTRDLSESRAGDLLTGSRPIVLAVLDERRPTRLGYFSERTRQTDRRCLLASNLNGPANSAQNSMAMDCWARVNRGAGKRPSITVPRVARAMARARGGARTGLASTTTNLAGSRMYM